MATGIASWVIVRARKVSPAKQDKSDGDWNCELG